MTATTPSATEPRAEAQILLTRLLDAQRRANQLALYLGAASLLGISVYFVVIYQKMSEYLQPPVVVELAEHMLDENLPQAREALESQLRDAAPAWAAALSVRSREALPAMREQLEQFALERVDQIAADALDLSEERLRGYVSKNRPLLEETLRDVAGSPDRAQQRLEELRQHFEDELDADFALQAKQLLENVSLMRQKLALLSDGSRLSDEQQLERRILMLTRRLQLDHLGSVTEKPTEAMRDR